MYIYKFINNYLFPLLERQIHGFIALSLTYHIAQSQFKKIK